eukprot:1161010-Pelagomonas_calceolata.AAC.5
MDLYFHPVPSHRGVRQLQRYAAECAGGPVAVPDWLPDLCDEQAHSTCFPHFHNAKREMREECCIYAAKYKKVCTHLTSCNTSKNLSPCASKELSDSFGLINIDTENWPPRFCKLELVFEGGKRMAFVDGRRFGKVKLQSNPLTESKGCLKFEWTQLLKSQEARNLECMNHCVSLMRLCQLRVRVHVTWKRLARIIMLSVNVEAQQVSALANLLRIVAEKRNPQSIVGPPSSSPTLPV